ncbi:hypothetical protein DC53_02115 [Pseudoalteromonas fuliginea]|uniref:Uncharacterized protein n=1 Tax=Pseudoalteromonas fuliginea TaxID=1872678 RepID=A0ABD3YE62_9GAMM|nr:hypothetical protein DC53_02115 [Pseudoalteromonas fuliginea]
MLISKYKMTKKLILLACIKNKIIKTSTLNDGCSLIADKLHLKEITLKNGLFDVNNKNSTTG